MTHRTHWDWYCCPRFDSPSVFVAILDAEKGGYFRIAPESHQQRLGPQPVARWFITCRTS